MASFTLSIVGAAGGSFGDLTTAFQITDDDSDRVLAYIQAVFGTDAQGGARTPQQAVDAFCEALTGQVFERVVKHEKAQAAAQVAELPFSRIDP